MGCNITVKKNPLASSVHPPKSLRNIPGSLSVQPPKGLLHGSLHRNSSTSFFGDAKDLKNFKVLGSHHKDHKIGSQNLGQNLPLPRNFEKSSARATSKFSRLLTSMKLVKKGWQSEKRHWETRDGYWEVE